MVRAITSLLLLFDSFQKSKVRTQISRTIPLPLLLRLDVDARTLQRHRSTPRQSLHRMPVSQTSCTQTWLHRTATRARCSLAQSHPR
ncbi:hypothetical protein BO86DRAFT_224745 [Aspergillus japonicus CBS 114.51]|uniref:Uncharacterized protein n=1 Tax=Aspergillus japonicus CBS 114.51 TaxID=1448312 RepID=A0A8T8WPL6_ASPJA|nr:hypothetical protein BO86DRAFT_224745 [Aspergillus japonicus CBS 114.51]RAH77329.1 hypothetical protein BO86DRAFT_224745 [Aspergillus japonicus CBS 114.51]